MVHARPLRIAVQDYRGHSRRLVHALFRAGHRAARGDTADLLLIDIDPPAMADRFDVPCFPHRQIIEHYKSAGASVLLCPHGVNPALYYDGLFEPYESVRCPPRPRYWLRGVPAPRGMPRRGSGRRLVAL